MDITKLTTEQLERMDKKVLITIIVALQGQLASINQQLSFLTEQIALMNQRSFGRKTEAAAQFEQLSLFDVFNEPECLSDKSKEPEITEVIIPSHSRKKKSKREVQLDGITARVHQHRIEKEKLEKLFPHGYKELPDEVFKRLSIIPQQFIVDEHHVHVYVSRDNDGTIVRAERPASLFRNSIATPSLVATIMTGKYQNHLPLERQSECFKASGVKLETNTLANWMMAASNQYLSLLFEALHKRLFDSRVIHADETPFQVIKDGRKAGSKSWMWVYRNGACDSAHPIVIYDYQPTRKTDHPAEFLKGYSGILVTDGYQPYHTLDKKRDDLQVAGCWVHAKRKFAEYVKAVGSENLEGIIAAEATKQISALCHMDNQFDDLTKEERERQRQQVLKPRVNDFFKWVKASISKLPSGSNTAKGLLYCINQEPFLRVFLSNGDVPMDNNRAEQAIRPFTIGRKNWVNMFSPNGADASAIIYSIVETAKANNLRVFEYLEFLLEKFMKHAKDSDYSFIEDLLPWSDAVQEVCRSRKKS